MVDRLDQLVAGRHYRIADNAINRHARLPVGATTLIKGIYNGYAVCAGARFKPTDAVEWFLEDPSRLELACIESPADMEALYEV